MKPLSVIVNNFLPFQGQYKIDFQTISSGIVSGPNGAGKSSLIVDAPLFALFGKARKRPEGLICDGTDEMWVEFVFEHKGSIYKVKRSIKRGKQQLLSFFTNVSDSGKQVDLTERLLTNTQEKLNKTLGFSYELLLAISVVQQEEINRLLKMTASEREQILAEMLSLAIWEQKRKKINELITSAKNVEEELELKELELIEIENQITQFTSARGNVDVELEQLLSKKKLLNVEYDQLKETEKEKERYDLLIGKIARLKGEITQIETQLNSKRRTKFNIKQDIQQVEQTITETNSLIAATEQAMSELDAAIKQLQSTQNEVVGLIDKQAQTKILDKVPCIQTPYHSQCQLLSLARQTKTDLLEKLKQYGITDLDQFRRRLDSEIQEISNKISELSQHCKDISNISKQDEKKKTILVDELKETERQDQLEDSQNTKITVLGTVEYELGTIPKVDAERLNDVRTKLMLIIEQEKLLVVQQTEVKKEIEFLVKAKLKIQLDISTLKEQKTKLIFYKTLYQAYNDIPSLLFAEAIPNIEQYTNSILARIHPGREIYLRTHRDTKAGTQSKALDVVGSTLAGLREFDDLSGSEKFRESLALRIALAKVNGDLYNTPLKFFIIDEGFGSLDDQNVQVVKQTLREIAKQFELFLVVTHVEVLRDTFENEIVIKPSNETPRIEVVKHKTSGEVALDI